MIPSGRFFAVAVALAVGVACYPGQVPGGTWVGLVVLNGLLAVLAAVDHRLAPQRHQIAVRRDHPHSIVVGSTATITWTVEHTRSSVLKVRLADELVPSLGATTRRCRLVVPVDGSASASTEFTPRRRGRFEPTRLTVSTLGPMGLAWRQSIVRTPTALHVHPPFRSRKVTESRIRRARSMELGSRTSPGVGHGSEFAQLRSYLEGDQVRHIDWGATARTGKPIVRTFQPEHNHSVIVLLDNGRLMAGKVDGIPRLEHGIDATIALATVAGALGDRVGLVTFDQRSRSVVAPGSGATHVARLTNAMFDLFPELLESDYHEVFASTVARFRRRSLLVLVTELSGAAARESLFPALPTLVRRHSVLVASVRDPDLTAWADGAAGNLDEVFRSGTAAATLRERRLLTSQAEALGAVVIDAEPGQLSGALVDAYINQKFR